MRAREVRREVRTIDGPRGIVDGRLSGPRGRARESTGRALESTQRVGPLPWYPPTRRRLHGPRNASGPAAAEWTRTGPAREDVSSRAQRGPDRVRTRTGPRGPGKGPSRRRRGRGRARRRGPDRGPCRGPRTKARARQLGPHDSADEDGAPSSRRHRDEDEDEDTRTGPLIPHVDVGADKRTRTADEDLNPSHRGPRAAAARRRARRWYRRIRRRAARPRPLIRGPEATGG